MIDQVLLDIVAATAVIAVVLTMAYTKRNHYANLPYPPGPRKLPVLKNFLDMPTDHSWLTYARWSQEFDSDLIHLSAVGTDVLVLNNVATAIDLLDKRSVKYSDRPTTTMGSELTDLARWSYVVLPYGKKWRDCRKLSNIHFQIKAIENFRPRIKTAVREMVKSMMKQPDDFFSHTRLMASELVLGIAYNINPRTQNGDLVKLIEKTNESAEALIAGRYMVDMLPILKYVPEWFPRAGFKRQARMWRQLLEQAYTEPYEAAKREACHGDSTSDSMVGLSFNSAGLSGMSKYDENILMVVTGSLFAAGSETTGLVLQIFILAMILYPKTQRRAQEEIESVIGTNRLPEFEDADSLPYVKALIQEVLRWHPVAPLGVPHRLTEDDEYKGYWLPKGSIVLPNAWSMSRDERVFPGNLNEFEPARFLTLSGELDPNVSDVSFGFGFGRRVCPGRFLANDTLYLAISSILATLTIEKDPNDLHGPKADFSGGLVSAPVPFRCSIKPRFSGAEMLISEVAQ